MPPMHAAKTPRSTPRASAATRSLVRRCGALAVLLAFALGWTAVDGRCAEASRRQTAKAPAGAASALTPAIDSGAAGASAARVAAAVEPTPGSTVWTEAAARGKLTIDEPRIAATGIRKLTARHLTLYTDVPPSPAVDELPTIFDLAVPQWCDYLNVPMRGVEDWKVIGCLMADRQRFREAGLLPDELPAFQHGCSRHHELWLYDQPSEYYRRHLLLHEGTHAFMFTNLGSCGPTWYMEATAELLGTHAWENGRLTLGSMPRTRDEVPYWGRIAILRDAFREGRAKPMTEIFRLPAEAFQDTSAYGWVWGAAAFLDGHPRYQHRFRSLPALVTKPDFQDRVRAAFHRDWRELNEEWQVFVGDVEYGYDFQRTAIDFTPGRSLAGGDRTVSVAADRGWQNSGCKLEAGKSYHLTAAGRYQLGTQPQIWWCEPNGISMRYYHGRPLGQLLAVVRPEVSKPDEPSAFLQPQGIGLSAALAPSVTGTLYLRINDSAAELSDNAGTCQVQIRPSDDSREAAPNSRG